MKTGVRCGAAWLAMAALGASRSLAAAPEAADGDGSSLGALAAPADGVPTPQGELDLSAVLARAVAAYEAGDLVSAQALFSAVHAHAPTARTLRSLGIVAFRQGRFGEAVTQLEASLVSEVRPLTEAQIEGVHVLIAEAKSRLAANANLPAPVLAEAEASVGAVPEATSPSAAQQAASPRTSPVSPVRAAPEASRRTRRAGYGLLGAGALSLVASAALTGLAYARLHRLEDLCRAQGGCTESEARAGAEARHLNLLANLGLAAGLTGGAAAVAGLTVLVVPGRGEAARGSLHIGWRRSF